MNPSHTGLLRACRQLPLPLNPEEAPRGNGIDYRSPTGLQETMQLRTG